MSRDRTTTIACAREGCAATYTAPGSYLILARTDARIAGWQSVAEPLHPTLAWGTATLDYCPEHAAVETPVDEVECRVCGLYLHPTDVHEDDMEPTCHRCKAKGL